MTESGGQIEDEFASDGVVIAREQEKKLAGLA